MHVPVSRFTCAAQRPKGEAWKPRLGSPRLCAAIFSSSTSLRGLGLVGTSNGTDRSSVIVVSLQMTLAGPASPRLGKPHYPAWLLRICPPATGESSSSASPQKEPPQLILATSLLRAACTEGRAGRQRSGVSGHHASALAFLPLPPLWQSDRCISF